MPSRTPRWPGRPELPAGNSAWTFMVRHLYGDIALFVNEEGNSPRPCAVAFSGNYPRALDGLARVLSLDMRVIDPAWIGMKLRKLLNYAEPLGHFMAFVPGEKRQQTWPSTCLLYTSRCV